MAGPDFSKSTIDTLAQRAGFQCSNPACRVNTVGPNGNVSKSTVIGEAAHIKGAKPGAKRYDSSMSDAERAAISNGIWLCRNCHGLIDRDEVTFTADVLFRWRSEHEEQIAKKLGARELPQQSITTDIRRERDVASMRQLMSCLNIPALEQHIHQLPHTITETDLFFHQAFSDLRNSTSFHLYDPTLDETTKNLSEAWDRATQYAYRYRSCGNGHYIFSNEGDAPLSSDQQTDWDNIEKERHAMMHYLVTLLNYIRNSYIEIDIRETNENARKRYASIA
ncbi:HNH endonuclease [Acetobacter syzygii]|uniref:HNH endonuclease n=1 Tax=Acetobacter syzygii TaxID=146476 RepID=A0A270B4X6_9PROT|nr:HNH endonuclease [Acetobacter syzygii]PAL20028.1 hypothetical protein B9K05_13320 [Acetobacter syzygii]PAL20989.1 hypothetical protein B9K04_13265 [Acetobacter syzygii]